LPTRVQFFLRSKLPDVLYGSKPRVSFAALGGESANASLCGGRLRAAHLYFAHTEAQPGVLILQRFVIVRHRSSLFSRNTVLSTAILWFLDMA